MGSAYDLHQLLSVLLSSGTITTCFNDLSLSRPGFECPSFRMWSERSIQVGKGYKPVNWNDRKLRELIHTQIVYVTHNFRFLIVYIGWE